MSVTSPAPASQPAPDGPAARPSRADLVGMLDLALRETLPAHGLRGAWQGATDAVASWQDSTGPADLDLWVEDGAAYLLDTLLRALPAARVQHADDPRRLRHTSYAVETSTGVAVVDVTRGHLAVGPVLLVADADVSVAEGRLTGVAAAADLVVRPLLRGRIAAAPRLAEGRAAWAAAPVPERLALRARLREQLGSAVADGADALLSGGDAPEGLVGRTRRAYTLRTLRPSQLGAAWAQRHVVVPAGRSAGPLGLRTRGALVVLVGTDGSGKSTVAAEIASRLGDLGVSTTTAHLGMARGNLPGVGLARRVLGVRAETGEAPAPLDHVDVADEDAAPAPLSHPGIRKAAAWYYAVEYGWRWLRDVRPGLRHGGVVIADRYVYDLRESPWPGSSASRFAERVLPSPAVLVLPDAPAELIHARKPERPLREQREQQIRFASLLAEHPALVAEVVVDTSGLSMTDDVATVVAAVLEALHRP